jgi:hypothetical protein
MEKLTKSEIEILKQSLKCTLVNLESLETSPNDESETEMFLDTAHETIVRLHAVAKKIQY